MKSIYEILYDINDDHHLLWDTNSQANYFYHFVYKMLMFKFPKKKNQNYMQSIINPRDKHIWTSHGGGKAIMVHKEKTLY